MDPARGQQAFTAATVLDDSPISVRSGNAVWTPQNYDLRFHGQVTVREALAHSYNIPAVRAAMNAGVPNVIKTAATIGIESHLAPYPSVSLGSFEVTPLEIAYAYSAFANLGVKAEPISILAVVDARREAAGDARSEDEARGAGERLLRDERRPQGRLRTTAPPARRAPSASSVRSPARPERRATIATPGSSAIRRASSRWSGSASTTATASGSPAATPACRSGRAT